MTEKLIRYLLQFGDLNAQQIELIKSKVLPLRLTKEDYFSEAGKISKRVGFVEEGILRVCYYNKDGNELTRYFIDENNFAVDLNSFNSQLPSSEYIQAITDCTLLVLSAESLRELSVTIVNWDAIVAKITERSLLEKVNRISPMLAEDAATRYASFLNRYPNLANRIPMSFLASYIGITQSSLSRIRKKIR